MQEHENLYEKIQEILGGSPGKLKILEDQIDMDLQVEYYECSKRIKEDKDEAWAFEHILPQGHRILPEIPVPFQNHIFFGLFLLASLDI